MPEPTIPGMNGHVLPMWVRVIMILGFPTALAVFLLAQNAGYINNPSNAQAEILMGQHAQMLKLVEGQDLAMREHRIRQEDLIRLLATGFKVMCENNSKTPAERNNCQTIQQAVRYLSP